MKARMKCFTTFASLAMAGALLLTGAAAVRGLTASAAEEPDPTYPESGWYQVGNGNENGSLAKCSWTEYLPDFRLEGDGEDDPTAEYQNYLGVWHTEELTLYNNDQFKFLYESGKWEYPDESGWGNDIVAGYYNLTGDADGNFTDGGLGNIQVSATGSGKYVFTLTVEEDETSALGVSLTLRYRKTASLDPQNEYRMYVVGTIASLPKLGWPGEEGKDSTLLYMTARWVEETDEETGVTSVVKKYYSELIVFVTTDQVKVYNAADNLYYPSGVGNNQSPTADGSYYVEWKEDAPSIKFVTELPEEKPAPTRPAPDAR